jgi:MSHA biogenesis protein MshP
MSRHLVSRSAGQSASQRTSGSYLVALARSPHRQRGFSLVAAIFLLTVLALLGAFAVRIGGAQQHTVDLSLLGARALSAAQAGIEWGAHRALVNGACPASTDLTLNEGSLNGFRLTVTCAATAHTEGATPITIFIVTSFAQSGTYGQPDYVSRTVRARFTDVS